ncbi:MAG: GNAT family N-acetyltransferase [Myxococcales bacterium]|nr:GNAT family N-acetyltransferase [Myxococcales bacterium]
MLEVHCATSLEELAARREELNALNLASRLPDPFSTFEFYELYCEHDEFRRHGVDTQLWFLTVREEGRIVGYLPLRRARDRALGIGCWKVEFLATHDNDRPHLVARPTDEERCREAVFRWLRAHDREWSSLELKQQPADSTLRETAPFGAPRHYVRTFPNLENSSIEIRWKTLREWFRERNQKRRKNISRQFRMLAELGRLEHLGSDDPAATPLLFELYRTIEARSWKAHAHATVARSTRRLEFFRELLGARSPLRVRIDLLLLDGVPVAGLVCGAFAKRLYAIHNVFDDAYAKVGPGGSVLLLGLREAIEGGYLTFNLLSGFGYYKARWAAEITPTEAVQIFRVGSARFLQALAGEMRRKLFAPAEPPPDFNLVRREATAAPAAVAAGERERMGALVGELARLGVVAAGQDALERTLPFSLRRAAESDALEAAS